MSRGEQLVQGNPAPAGPDDVPGIEPPPGGGVEPMGLAPATHSRQDLDFIQGQVARLPSQSEVSGGRRR